MRLNMKKMICLIIIVFLLSGCSKQQQPETDMTPYEMVSVIAESQSELPDFEQISAENENFFRYLSDYYMLSMEQVEDGVICYADGVEAAEIAVLVISDGELSGKENSEAVRTALTEYIKNRAGVFEGYAPQQAALVKNGIVVAEGRYVALLICQDTSAAKDAFSGCFDHSEKDSEKSDENRIKDGVISASVLENKEPETEESETKEQPETAVAEDFYDYEAILQAWESGDYSSLSALNLSILSAAKDVIDMEISDDMSDYEKELAIHDWITEWSSFDMSAFSHAPGSGIGTDSDNPYGVLIGRTGNCWGYSSTFQLFMDMLDIECITVYGTPGSSGVEHAWNMVKLDEEWYCVDVAWDDPIGGNPGHTYFNVTSEYLRKGSIHRWNEFFVPEATGTNYAYGNH